MGYRIVGFIIDDFEKINFKEKPYRSKIFKDEIKARKYAYSKVYEKDGNTKKTKNTLVNFYIEKVN